MAHIVDWDDAAADWERFALVVVRSTWDYAPRRDEFVAWADGVAAVTMLFNPADVLRWNTDKRYLRDLQAGGVPIVPTTWIERGDAFHPPDDVDFVVKPAVSAGAKHTARYGPSEADAAREQVRHLTEAGRSVMIQPYVAGIEDHGETGLVFCADRFSHAISKAPILGPSVSFIDGLYAEERITPRSPSDAELSLAERILDLVPRGRERLLYARVDLVPGRIGPVLLELEATEPSLFLDCAPGSADRFAAAIAERIAAP
ncbi:MAG: RimK family alpha-L-glutamate ligase [Candidatus Limnocylindria bacterium]